MSSPEWQQSEVKSPRLGEAVPVVAAKGIPYLAHGNRLQNFNVYLRKNGDSSALVGTSIDRLPANGGGAPQYWHVHVHGGAWRDPNLLASSIEAAVAHAFSDQTSVGNIRGIISLNYTLSPFPTHPTEPYDPSKTGVTDPGRDAVHPRHVQDVIHAFAELKKLGLTDDSYILSGHSAGGCLTFQASLFDPRNWGLEESMQIPRPAALVGLNGLYDLPDLVDNLGDSHAKLKDVYQNLISIAFGDAKNTWPAASPARVDPSQLAERLQAGTSPRLVLLDQSKEDQLVPFNQMTTMKARLEKVAGLRVVQGDKCTGVHAAPWEQGYMIWDTVKDVLQLLA